MIEKKKNTGMEHGDIQYPVSVILSVFSINVDTQCSEELTVHFIPLN